MSTHEILVAARNLLDRQGFHQGRCSEYPGGRGGLCMFGALAYAARGRGAVAARVLNDHTPADSFIAWNDEPGRTKQEVLAAFDRAIAATAPLPENLDLEVPAEVAA